MQIDFIIMAIIAVVGLLANTGMKQRAYSKRKAGEGEAMTGLFNQLLPIVMGAMTGGTMSGATINESMSVKIRVPVDPNKAPASSESFWVKDIDSAGVGIVDNDLQLSEFHGFKRGDRIAVKKYEVLDIAAATPETAPNPTPKMTT